MGFATTRQEPASSSARVPGRLAARFADLAVSAYCWGGLSLNTAFFLGLAHLSRPLRGNAEWGSLFAAWARASLIWGGFDVRVSGLERVAAPAVLAANHQSVFDVALLAALVPPPVAFVARGDLTRLPIIGSVLRHGQHVILDRDSTARAVLDQIAERVTRGARVVFFAEGARSNDGTVGAFRAGAFHAAWRAECALVPVALAGTRCAIAKGSRRIRPSRLAVSFLDPVWLTREEATSRTFRRSIADRVAAAVSRMEPQTGPRLPVGQRGPAPDRPTS